MTITTISSRDFNQDVGKAKRATGMGPVIITDRGQPSHVLLTIDEYKKITGQGESILDLLAMHEAADIDFDSPKAARLIKAVEFD